MRGEQHLLGCSLEKLTRGREAEPFVDGHGFAAGVNRHPTRPKVQGVLRCGLHERRADALPALFRHDEDALDVSRAARGRARPRHPGHERQPRHANDLGSGSGLGLGQSCDKGEMRVVVVGPPRVKVDREGRDGLIGLLVRCRVQPAVEPGAPGPPDLQGRCPCVQCVAGIDHSRRKALRRFRGKRPTKSDCCRWSAFVVGTLRLRYALTRCYISRPFPQIRYAHGNCRCWNIGLSDGSLHLGA